MKKLIVILLVLLIGFSVYVYTGSRSLDTLRKEEAALKQQSEDMKGKFAEEQRRQEEIEAAYGQALENNRSLEEELTRWQERTEQLRSLLN